MYCVDVALLKAKTIIAGTTFEGLAHDLGIDRTTFYRRLRTNTLRVGDIHKIVEVLHLTPEDTIAIFLCPAVA